MSCVGSQQSLGWKSVGALVVYSNLVQEQHRKWVEDHVGSGVEAGNLVRSRKMV